MPYYPEEAEEVRHSYSLSTGGPRMVAEYARMSVPETLELNIIDYMTLRRDAYIHALSKTQKGQEYLENAWLREQTEPDRAGLRKLIHGD